MRICYLTHNLKHDNGAGVFSARLCEDMQRRGYVVSALTSLPSDSEYEQPLLSGGFTSILKNFLKIRQACKGADIIHALDAYPYGVLAWIASFGLGKPLVVTAVGTGSIAGLYKFPQRVFISSSYRAATAVVAISSFTKHEILKRVPGLNIQVITHGVDPDRFDGEVLKNLPKEITEPYILSVGSLRWRKGYKHSISVFSQLVEKFPELSYVIVGKKYTQKEYDNLHTLIESLRLQNKVFILDTVDDDLIIRTLYRKAYVFFLLSQNVNHDVEGFGLVFLEAAAAGVPTVGSQDSGVVDAMQDGSTGFLVPPQDERVSTEVLSRLLSDKPLRDKMGKAGYAFAQANRWESKFDQYENLYLNLMNSM